MLKLLLEINTETLNKGLNILWQGLLAVVIVVGIIMAVTYVMLFISKRVAESKENKNKTEADEENATPGGRI